MIRVYANLPAAIGTIYAIAQDADGAFWTGAAYVTEPMLWSDAAIELTRAGERVHADLPDGAVTWDIRRQVGESPASTDKAIWFESLASGGSGDELTFSDEEATIGC